MPFRPRAWLAAQDTPTKAFITLAAVGAAAVGVYFAGRDTVASRSAVLAAQAETKREFKVAAGHYRDAFDRRPDSGDLAFKAARAARRAGDFAEADRLLKRAEELDWPGDVVKFERMLIAAPTGRLRSVEKLLRAYVEQEPTPTDADVVLDVLIPAYLNYPDPGGAVQALAPWLERKPDEPRYRAWQGDAAVLARDWPTAKAAYLAALAAAPDDAATRFKLAEALRTSGDAAGAKEQFNTLLAKAPTHPEYRFGAARCDRVLGDLPAAAEKLDVMLKENATDARVLAERGAVFLAGKDDTAAREKLLRAAALDEVPEISLWISDVLSRTGPTAPVTTADIKLWRQRADQTLEGQKELDPAAAAVEAAPRDADARAKLGTAYAKIGDHTAAILWLRSALAENPLHPTAGQVLKELADNKYGGR